MNTVPTTMVPPRTAFMSAFRSELVKYAALVKKVGLEPQ